ncbi:GntR family transcriptional regulator [Micromonospora sp. Llam7]|uniref:GntR family transcriptional regulator n=1 Tax=Micromonospora tarapacensis TaxID=2835305 RepID=UPI001C835F0A|nr:GntR family transcriptional regulator [Micromonospora tarapacensis]MBX7264772.1 GntR family transcriptional regulator [Micromonospora tarapacensis]
MDPRPTAVQAPIHLRIADDIRMKIERGDLRPGAPLPTLAELCERWSCSMNSARSAVALLKAQGLIVTGRGKAPTVRVQTQRVVRSSERHQIEKDLAIKSESERAKIGEAETNLAMSISDQRFTSVYDQVAADEEISNALEITQGDGVLRRRYESFDSSTGYYLSKSVSYIPLVLVESNPALLDQGNEPWPGGTQHQLMTVGIEIDRMVDRVTARMPTTVEAQMWNLPAGVPLILCRRVSCDLDGRVVEISDADYPADRSELEFVTKLRPWPKKRRPT